MSDLGTRHSSRRIGYIKVFLAAFFGTVPGTGCSNQNPRFRTYVSPDRDPTLLEHVERPVELLQQALDNLDRDLENIIY